MQVETERTDVWVPDGLALPQRSYYPAGLNVVESMVLPEKTNRVSVTSPLVGYAARPEQDTKKLAPITRIEQRSSGDVFAYKDVQIGPVWAQTGVPLVVSPGDRVRMSGQFALRRTGLNQKDDSYGNSNQYFGLDVKVVLWGIGVTTDEYGVDTDVEVELMTYQAPLQLFVFNQTAGVEQIVFTIPAASPAVVPENVDRVHLTIGLWDNTHTRGYMGATYTPYFWGSIDPNYCTLSTVNPLRIHTYPPSGMFLTEPHASSSTGAGFRNRHYYSNIQTGCEVTVLAPENAASTVEVWEWTGTARLARLASITLAAGERRTVAVTSSTGQIDVSAIAGDTWVESVWAPINETLTTEQTRTHRYTYLDVIDPVARVVTDSIEADLSVCRIRFVSDSIDTVLPAGKRMRVLGKFAGGFEPIFTGTIRNRRIVHDLSNRAQVEIAVHDSFPRLGVECHVAYETVEEYGRLLHTIGCRTIINGVEYSGPSASLPSGYEFFPSYTDDGLDLRASLLMARNTTKSFLFFTRRDEQVITDTLPDVVLDVSDRPQQGDMSYTQSITLESDTKELVNIVGVTEHLLDRKDFQDRNLGSEEPPIDFDHVRAKSQSVDYRRAEAIELYGQSRVAFDVVRGSGSLSDLVADNYGRTFKDWASEILDAHGSEATTVRSLRLVVTSAAEIELVSRLGVLDAIAVRVRGDTQVRRIRKLHHEIQPNKWFVDIDFTPTADQTYWLPETAAPVASIGDVDAGTLSSPATSTVDGGHPTDTVTLILDGGTL
nr:hypothetical protein [Rhodococcus sp. 06-418-1B]